MKELERPRLSCPESACRPTRIVREADGLRRVERILAEAHAQTKIRIAAYCLMPNHSHLLLWPRHDG